MIYITFESERKYGKIKWFSRETAVLWNVRFPKRKLDLCFKYKIFKHYNMLMQQINVCSLCWYGALKQLRYQWVVSDKKEWHMHSYDTLSCAGTASSCTKYSWNLSLSISLITCIPLFPVSNKAKAFGEKKMVSHWSSSASGFSDQSVIVLRGGFFHKLLS